MVDTENKVLVHMISFSYIRDGFTSSSDTVQFVLHGYARLALINMSLIVFFFIVKGSVDECEWDM